MWKVRVNKSYKFRIYPTKKQEILLSKTFGCTRFIWNQMLSEKQEYYEKEKKLLRLTPAKYKKEYKWLKEVDSLSLSNVQLQQEKAYKNFFRNKKFGFPKFKSKHNQKQSYTTSKVANNINLIDGYIKLPKLKQVKIKKHRDVIGNIKSVTISKNSCDKYYVAILVEYEKEVKYKKDINKTVGIDMSMENFIVTSDGEKANYPHWFRRTEKKVTKAQHKLSKKQKRSQNRIKQKKCVAIIHEHIVNQRKDYIEKLSRKLINKYDYIVLEDINLQNMQQSLRLGKSVSDLGFGKFRERLQQKADEEGKEIIKIDKWFPSSKLCSFCGWKYSKLQLKERNWVCAQCGATHDRDINAAINLKNKFIKDTVGTTEFQACGEASSGLLKLVSETSLRETGSSYL
jgi:putative transposase